MLPPKPCEGTWFTNYVRKRLPLAGEAGSPQAETDEVELAKTLLFDIVPKAASTSSAPAGHLPLVGEGFWRMPVKIG